MSSSSRAPCGQSPGSPFRVANPSALRNLVLAHVGKSAELVIASFIPAFLVPCEQVKNPNSAWLVCLLIKLSLQTGLTAKDISVIYRHSHRCGWYLSRMYWILWETIGLAKPPPPSIEISCAWIVYRGARLFWEVKCILRGRDILVNLTKNIRVYISANCFEGIRHKN